MMVFVMKMKLSAAKTTPLVTTTQGRLTLGVAHTQQRITIVLVLA